MGDDGSTFFLCLTNILTAPTEPKAPILLQMAQLNMIKSSATSKVILGGVFLMLGCTIYLLFRSKTLNLYQWCSALGLSDVIDYARIYAYNWNIPDFVRYSLPDGLYCAAYILIMDAIWHDGDSLIKNFIIALIPTITVTSEVLQFFGLVKGTFDSCDLLLYSIPIIAYYFNKYHSFKFNDLKHKGL